MVVTCKHQACATFSPRLRSREARSGRTCPLLWRRRFIAVQCTVYTWIFIPVHVNFYTCARFIPVHVESTLWIFVPVHVGKLELQTPFRHFSLVFPTRVKPGNSSFIWWHCWHQHHQHHERHQKIILVNKITRISTTRHCVQH